MRMLEINLANDHSMQPANPAADASVCGTARLAALVCEHDDLDCAISALLAAGSCDDLLIRRLKKHKLHLKDEIARLSPMAMQNAG